MNFRELLESVRSSGRHDQPPRTWEEIADLLAISASHLRSLMTGRRTAPRWTVRRIATRLDTTEKRVQKALDLTKAQSNG